MVSRHRESIIHPNNIETHHRESIILTYHHPIILATSRIIMQPRILVTESMIILSESNIASSQVTYTLTQHGPKIPKSVESRSKRAQNTSKSLQNR